MIVDSSALVAIVKGEADAETLLESLLTVPRPAISAATLVGYPS
ncbi:type II toxin-antitoxin system VapC family toxin [Microbacterium aurum]